MLLVSPPFRGNILVGHFGNDPCAVVSLPLSQGTLVTSLKAGFGVVTASQSQRICAAKAKLS